MDIIKMGVFLRNTRKSLKLTQNDIALQIGISPQAISKWERGDNLPDVTYFPDIARIYEITIDELLNAGKITEEKSIDITNVPIQMSLDNNVFEQIISYIRGDQSLHSLNMSFDFFPYLSNGQKHIILDIILVKEDYGDYLDEILPFTTSSNKRQILGHLLEKEHYELLEHMGVHLNNEMKQLVIDKLLITHNFTLVEDMITIFNKKQRNSIIDFLENNTQHLDIIENFIPFFDNTQLARVQNLLK